MRTIYLLLTAFILFQLTSCETTEPQPPKEEKPPGYQEDIPWPSLADSPWPRYHGNAQNNGRTNVLGPQTGTIVKIIEMDEIESGIVVGADSGFYFATTSGYLYSMTKDGEEKWKIKLTDKEIMSTPLIGTDGTIYIGLFQEEKFVAVNNNGTIKWEFNISGGINDLITNIGLDGTLYFIDETSHLNAINQQGILLWSLYSSRFNGLNELTFSQDGNILYIISYDQAITALDINNRQILWVFNAYNITSAVVDAFGNIYFVAKGTNDSFSAPTYMYCLSNNGVVKWVYELSSWKFYAYQDPTIDKDGNIYFASDTLYSLDYKGKLRWEKGFKNKYFRHPIICDGTGNLFTIMRDSNDGHFEIISFSRNGEVRWRLPRYDSAQGLFETSGAIGYDNYWYVALSDWPSKLYLIK